MNQPKYTDCLPAYGQDIFNYLAADSASDHQLHMVLTFNGQLSQNLLAKALRKTMDIEPVLGCRFVEHPKAAYFKPRADLDTLDLCPVCVTEYPDTELRNFIALSIDSQKDPLVQAKIFRTQNKDILCLKLDHTVSDGGGLKEYMYLLAKVYTHLCSHSAYPVSESPSRRDAARVLNNLGIADPLKAWQPPMSPPAPAWSFPATQYKHQQPAFSMRQLTKEQLPALKVFAKNHAATINDILLTAYYRALFKITATPEDSPQPISVSADLRRYTPDKAIISNISSSLNTLLSNHTEEAFVDTFKRVTKITAELKQKNAIIPTALFFEFLGSLNFSEVKKFHENISQQNHKVNTIPPFFSNVGIINPVSFGEYTALEGYIVTPAMFAPLFMLGASTYNNVLTIIVNYYTSDTKSELIQTLLDSIVMDLENLIRR
jgi:NRPS condensation-like uncharacterized protein